MRSRSPRRKLVELLVALGLVVVLCTVLLPALMGAREGSRRASCQNNLKQMGLVFKMFANEHDNACYPPRSPYPNNWIVDTAWLYPEYLSDLNILLCPSNPFTTSTAFHSASKPDAGMQPECVSSISYIYTGYAIGSDEEALALFEAGEAAALNPNASVELDVPIWPESGRRAIRSETDIPVMWDRLSVIDEEAAHTPLGINVLHMDGSVRFVSYSPYNNSSYFPATRINAETFSAVLPELPIECL